MLPDVKKLSFLTLLLILVSIFTPETQAQSNTRVRFRVSYGATVLGNIDVELFDQDKPATVANFLAYLDSGRYKRTYFHRLIPGSIIQGGAGTIMNPYSGAAFQIVNVIPKYAPLNNEFNVGPVLSNLFGTIAMAKHDTNANSATSSFYFNLGNNSSLDVTNGGYTVFGRVIAGTNYFTLFNGFSTGKGIMDVSDFFYGVSCGFTYTYENGVYDNFIDGEATPIAYTKEPVCVRYSDLLILDIFRLDSSNTDSTPPTVAITSPLANSSVNTTDVTVTGTASDVGGVETVDVILNHERLTVATGGPTWSVTLTNVYPGTNTLTVVAVDSNGNQSKPVFRNVFVRQQDNVDIVVTGQGTVTGLTDGQVVDQGRNYKLIAKPATGHLFSHWQGGFGFGDGRPGARFNPTLICYFYPETNALVEAVFIPNPFIPTKGAYNGLFSEPGVVRNERSGFFTMNLTDRGTYSGKLNIEGKNVPFKGLFDLDGTTSTTVVRNGSNNLFLNLALDITNGTCQVTGTVSRLNESWYASLVADQARFNIKTNPAPRAGSYTMVIPGSPASATSPQGDSYGTVKIDGNGRVTFAGVMADGSKFTQKTALSKDDNWPFFGSLYKGKGITIGRLDVVTNDSATAISGNVAWLKTAAAGGTLYPNGFSKTTNVIGSKFVKPATATQRIVDISTGTVAFSGGSLSPEFSNEINIAPNSVVTTTSPNKLTLTFNKASGLMSGTVVHPNGTPTLKFGGVVLQQQVGGSGFFLNTNASGLMLMAPTP
jgi:cyclophilin family peptidyl-prolyl cis-trans isomerase